MKAFPPWYFDESKMAGVDFQEATQVEAYDSKQTSSTLEKEQALVTRLGISSGNIVIDLGSGTGNFAIQAALAGAFVHAVDVSQAMLNYAQNKAQKANVTKLKFFQAGFLTYEHKDDLVDFVVTKNALHILPDFWKMIALLRIAQLLKPNGVFYLRDVIFSFSPPDYEKSLNEWIKQVGKPENKGWTAKEFEQHVREEYSTFAWIIEPMLTKAGVVTVTKYLDKATHH